MPASIRDNGHELLHGSYMDYFESILFNFFFPFWTCYVDNTFTLIDIPLHNIDNILNINSNSTAIFISLKNRK